MELCRQRPARQRAWGTWASVAALTEHEDPTHRLFAAEVLRLTHLFDGSEEDPFGASALDLFADWSARETDLAVLTEVLVALGEHKDPRSRTALLPHAAHADARVRCAVAWSLDPGAERTALGDEVRAALLMLMTDEDPEIGATACSSVGKGGGRAPVLADAMAGLLDDADRHVALTAVYGLAAHQDERCVEAADRLGAPRPEGTSEQHYLEAARRYEWRRQGR